MTFLRVSKIFFAALLILFALSFFYCYISYDNNRTSSSLYFGGHRYNFDKISGSMELKKSFSHTIDGEDYVVQLFVVADKNLNACDDDEIWVTLIWDGASETDQPDNFSTYTLNPLEKDLYYSLKHYISSALGVEKIYVDHNKLYIDLVIGGAEVERTVGEYRIIDLKRFLKGRGFSYSKSETRRIVVSDNRVVAWLDFFNGTYEEGGRKFNVKYKDAATDFYVQFTVEIGEEISSAYQCLFDTADAIATEFHSVAVNK